VRDLIAEAFDRAVDILKSRRSDLHRGEEMLLTRETLSAEDFPAIRPARPEKSETVSRRTLAAPSLS
jgi:cell division protease FtsH